jgi:NADH dehydrogenase
MTSQRILVIGGTGFIGRHVIGHLARRASPAAIVVPTRRRARARDLLPLPTVEVVEGDVHDAAMLAGLATGCHAVINLVGILHSRPGSPYGPDFQRAHASRCPPPSPPPVPPPACAG